MTGTRLGIDIGGTKVALRVEDAAGRSRESTFRWPVPADPRADRDALRAQVGELRAEWGGPVTAVGVAVPATLDAAGRVTAWPGRPGWAGLDLRGLLRGLFPDVPVRCADDGDLAALAEAAGTGARHVLYIGVGTGVGGGIVLDGALVPGLGRGSCEVGHLVIDRSGPVCDCGRRGCLQAVASGPATLRRAGRLRGRAAGFADLRAGLEEGRPWARAALEETCAALAVAVIGVTELVRPETVVVGGGFAAGLPGLVPGVAEHVRALARPGVAAPPVRPARLGALSSLHGALLLAGEGGPS
ncbi:ROK family protein [Actinomadura macrotermitis]|uniref:Kanosamine kinase n=1 Tax=Actinomadura macrotermitis TaxID=2585200 RepID=A0A7K0BZL0_9ACTN|nr:ROK family protein [Actinomadura macrotermitis]MQY06292.1 Kanosamine kinase [Actinomadura macrotermitis]